MQEEDGIMSKELIALDDKKFTSASSKRKLALVQYIQKLRLILWLLERRNYLTFRNNYPRKPVRSCLGYQGALNSSWNLANTYADLLRGLRVRDIDLSTTVPWIRKKAWLQYMFDRVRDQDTDAKTMMKIIFCNWIRFPFPDEGEAPQYYLTLPTSSASANPVFIPDSQDGEFFGPLNEDGNSGQIGLQQEHDYSAFDPLQERDYSRDLESWGIPWKYAPNMDEDENFSEAPFLQTQYKCDSCGVARSKVTAVFGGICERCKVYKRLPGVRVFNLPCMRSRLLPRHRHDPADFDV